jgi:hypothetical protein
MQRIGAMSLRSLCRFFEVKKEIPNETTPHNEDYLKEDDYGATFKT